jgi:hypothetical protein
MAKTNQIKKVVNGEIADADDVNQIVENAGNEGGSIPYEPVGHERDVLGSQSLGSTAYPYGTLSINQEACLNEIETTSPSVASSVAIKNLRKFIYLKDCPAAYTGKANYFVNVNAAETALEFTTPPFGWTYVTGNTFSGSTNFTITATIASGYVYNLVVIGTAGDSVIVLTANGGALTKKRAVLRA